MTDSKPFTHSITRVAGSRLGFIPEGDALPLHDTNRTATQGRKSPSLGVVSNAPAHFVEQQPGSSTETGRTISAHAPNAQRLPSSVTNVFRLVPWSLPTGIASVTLTVELVERTGVPDVVAWTATAAVAVCVQVFVAVEMVQWRKRIAERLCVRSEVAK